MRYCRVWPNLGKIRKRQNYTVWIIYSGYCFVFTYLPANSYLKRECYRERKRGERRRRRGKGERKEGYLPPTGLLSRCCNSWESRSQKPRTPSRSPMMQGSKYFSYQLTLPRVGICRRKLRREAATQKQVLQQREMGDSNDTSASQHLHQWLPPKVRHSYFLLCTLWIFQLFHIRVLFL